MARGLQEAAQADQLEIMQLLLENGAEIDEGVIIKARTIPAFQLLIKHGMQVNQPLSWGHVPLMYVVLKNDERLLGWFLAQGANPNLGPSDTNTQRGFVGPEDQPVPNSGGPLEMAVLTKNPKIVDILLSYGAEMQNALVLHTLIFADRNNWAKMMEHLVRHRVDINKFGYHPFLDNGGTPLLMAAKAGDVDQGRWLIEHEANPLIPDGSGLYPVQWAEIADEETETCAPPFREWHKKALDLADPETRERLKQEHARVRYARCL
ncbi:hypothetical protein N7474_003380 [Penicillium riverlandense]|uniref:uncharacterized protein n=1 Tax=Penicillium riverlandense TaxID=1903569 RepID=UPI002548BB6F|nr:uncharacterized protein N7474_003380 [Penicillium riverlandense]KAJ5826242.1 hypothetical protein N7474_003380 [Penicillium riverlandense]